MGGCFCTIKEDPLEPLDLVELVIERASSLLHFFVGGLLIGVEGKMAAAGAGELLFVGLAARATKSFDLRACFF